MKRLVKQQKFQPQASYSFWRFASESASIPRFWIFPGLEIPIVGMAAAGLLFVGLLAYFFIVEGEGAKTIVKVVNTLLFLLAAGSLALAGDNGRRFVHWFGWSNVLRKKGVPADTRPISMGVTRAFFTAVMALDLTLLTWWWVMLAAPAPDPFLFTDPLLFAEARLNHLLAQLVLYWWLPLLLYLPFLGFLKWMERLPIARVLLRQTKFLNIVALPVGFLVLRVIIRWLLELTGWSLSLKDFIPW